VDVPLEHSGSPQSEQTEEQMKTEPIDEKMRHSTSMKKKQGLKSRILKPTGDKST
jgi:hypothetical protein